MDSLLLIQQSTIILGILYFPPVNWPFEFNTDKKNMKSPSLERYLEMIQQAPVYDVARRTSLDHAADLSNRLGNQVFLKREDLQSVHSFKLRGAYTKIISLSEEERRCGVIAASAGNHAQGVALAAKKLGLHSIIVMPKTTPDIKVQAVQKLGSETLLHGNSYDDAREEAMRLVEEKDMTFVHPYDDPYVIAGQASVAIEILEQRQQIDAVFIPVGGGGLIAGMSLWIKQNRPEIKIIGVEPDDAACMYEALRANKRVVLEQVGLFADGVAVRQAGKETYALAKKYVDQMLTVTTDEICAAIKDIYDDTRSITEPAGALAIAGMKKYVDRNQIKNQSLIAVNSGANMNFDRLRHVAERAELGEQREFLFAATIPEEPGSFRKFCSTIGLKGITEFNYRYASSGKAHVFVGVKTQKGEAEKRALYEQLSKHGYEFADMSDNEMAKLHIRYMVGGRVEGLSNECLFRFEFPERPGALQRFLDRMGQHWNISLFHYRNHGAAFGRVLVGMQVPKSESDKLKLFLEELGYAYWDESNNSAYNLFLG